MSLVTQFLSTATILQQSDTYASAECPVCKGTSLKMNIAKESEWYGAYKCWSNNCPTRDIREALGIKAAPKVKSPFDKSDVFSPSQAFTSTYPLIKSAPPPNNFLGTNFLRLEGYQGNHKKTHLRTGGRVSTKTTYQYTPYLRVSRIDIPGQEKQIYIQSWDGPENGWLPGKGDKPWPLYGNSLEVISKCVNLRLADSVIIVEGEKACEWLRARGYAAFTFPAFAFHGSKAFSALLGFKHRFPNISNVLYIPDCDHAGALKEKYVRETCSDALLRFRDYRLDSLFSLGKGADVADLSEAQAGQLFNCFDDVCRG